MNDDSTADVFTPDDDRERVDEFNMFPPEGSGTRSEPTAPEQDPGESHRGVRADDNSSAVGPVIGSGHYVAGRDLDKRIINNGPLILAGEQVEQTLALASSAGRGTRRKGWDAEALRRLANGYVVPRGLLSPSSPHEKSAYEVLEDRRLLVLTAPVDRGGHHSAALRLAHEIRERTSSKPDVREEMVDPAFDLDPHELLDENDPTVLIVDLRDAGSADVGRVCNRLVEFERALSRSRSYLVLLVPGNHRRRLGTELPGRGHELGRPPVRDVLTCHLKHGVDPDALLAQPEFTELLDEAWPPRAAQVASWVSEAAESGVDDPAKLAESARSADEDWSPTLREEIDEHQRNSDPEWVTLLLAAALLEGTHAQYIVRSSDLLLAQLGHVPESSPLLRPGVVTTLEKIRETEFGVRDASFVRPRFGDSVLKHFWSEHPDMRDSLREWISGLPRNVRDMDAPALERLADRAAGMATVGGPRLAIDLAKRWSRTTRGENTDGGDTSDLNPDRTRRSLAVRLLTTTALEAGTGKHVREQLYNWAHQRSTPVDQKMVVAEVCGGAMSVEFPRVALTRLKHLAASENESVHAAVVEALSRIGEHLGPSGFLRYLAEWFDRADPARLATLAEGVEAVLGGAFVGGDVPPVDPAEGNGVRSFWRRALDDMPLEESRRVLAAWLRPAASAPEAVRGRMVEVLVEATEHQPHRIQRLYYASRIATPSSESSGLDPLGEIVQRMWTRLDEVDPLRV